MNEKFYALPFAKQNAIINTASKVFSKSDYKHATTDAIVKEAGISKGLLFHYFGNKKGLYLFLYRYCIDFLRREIPKYANSQETDFFDILFQTQRAKVAIMKQHPYMMQYLMTAYFEKDEEVAEDLGLQNTDIIGQSIEAVLRRTDYTKFKDGVDVRKVLKMIVWTSDGMVRDAIAYAENEAPRFAVPDEMETVPDAIDVEKLNEELLGYLEMLRKYLYKEEG